MRWNEPYSSILRPFFFRCLLKLKALIFYVTIWQEFSSVPLNNIFYDEFKSGNEFNILEYLNIVTLILLHRKKPHFSYKSTSSFPVQILLFCFLLKTAGIFKNLSL